MNTAQPPWHSIQCLVLDVDGICTDGKLYYNATGEAQKVFHVHDGHGIKALMQQGITVAIISGRQSAMVTQRFTELGVTHRYQGQTNKLPAYLALLEQLSLTDQQIAYMGDDQPDIPLIRRAGIGISVPNAHASAIAAANWVCSTPGGHGAVREICDLLLTAHTAEQPLSQHQETNHHTT